MRYLSFLKILVLVALVWAALRPKKIEMFAMCLVHRSAIRRQTSYLYYDLNEIRCLTHPQAVREPTNRWRGGTVDNVDNSLNVRQYFIRLLLAS